jgi:hypothetical protein
LWFHSFEASWFGPLLLADRPTIGGDAKISRHAGIAACFR